MIIFGVDMSSSPHVDNKKKDYLILLVKATVTAEKLDSINFTKEYKVLFELALP